MSMGSCLEAVVDKAVSSGGDIALAQSLLVDGLSACTAASVACIEAAMAQASGLGMSSTVASSNAASLCELQPMFDSRVLLMSPEPTQVVVWASNMWSYTWTYTLTFVGWYNLIQFVIMPWVFLWVFSGTILGLIRFCNVQYQLFRMGMNMLLLMILYIFVSVEEAVLHMFRVVYSRCNQLSREQTDLEVALKKAGTFAEYSRAQRDLAEFKASHEAWCSRRVKTRTSEVEDDEDDHITRLVNSLGKADDSTDLSSFEPLLVRKPGGIDWLTLPHSGKLAEQLSTHLRQVCMNYQQSGDAQACSELLGWLRARQKTLGVTALCLSGGGSLAMYHMGVCKFLIEEGLLPEVISCVSGGSIVGGMLCIHTDEEMVRLICKRDIVTRHGPQARWFPPWWKEMINFLRLGVLVPTEEFETTCTSYYGTWTFEEAFARTGREVSIIISSNFSQKLPGCIMLNHMTAPRVTIASAVATSCAAIGVMSPRGLVVKDVAGELKPFDVLGKSFQDGTVSVEFPKDYLRSLYGATQFLVSQVNPHVYAFMGQSSTTFQNLRRYFGKDLQKRARLLSEYRLLPAFFGKRMSEATQHLSQEFSESKAGLTMFSPDMGMGSLKAAVANPSVKDMDNYLLNGQRMGWDKVEEIRALMRTESTLSELIHRLEPRTYSEATMDQPPKLPKIPSTRNLLQT